MTWDEMEELVRKSYLEGVADGMPYSRIQRVISDAQLAFMWECSDAARDIPETTA